jgi:hypothetical protein
LKSSGKDEGLFEKHQEEFKKGQEVLLEAS